MKQIKNREIPSFADRGDVSCLAFLKGLLENTTVIWGESASPSEASLEAPAPGFFAWLFVPQEIF